MKLTRSRICLVLQGHFRVEQFRGVGPPATPVQPIGSERPPMPWPALLSAQMRRGTAWPESGPSTPGVPRPELLPAKMWGMVGQTKLEHKSGSVWRGAPRPELLPGMRPPHVGGPHQVAQARVGHGIASTPIPAGKLRVIGEGRPIDPEIRRTMESFFRADFSGVRIHEGPTAREMGALAFTLGEEIHFAPGLYNPSTREGVALLGHELTHVVQQREGRVANPYGHGVAIVQDPMLEAEADWMGQRIASELASRQRTGQPSVAHGRGFRLALNPNLTQNAKRPPLLATSLRRGAVLPAEAVRGPQPVRAPAPTSRPRGRLARPGAVQRMEGSPVESPSGHMKEYIEREYRAHTSNVRKPAETQQLLREYQRFMGEIGESLDEQQKSRLYSEYDNSVEALFGQNNMFRDAAAIVLNKRYHDICKLHILRKVYKESLVDEFYIEGIFLAYLAQALFNAGSRRVNDMHGEWPKMVVVTGLVLHERNPVLLVAINGHESEYEYLKDFRKVIPETICGSRVVILTDHPKPPDPQTSQYLMLFRMKGNLTPWTWHGEQKIVAYAESLGNARSTLTALGIAHVRGPCTEGSAGDGSQNCCEFLKDQENIAAYYYTYSSYSVELDDIKSYLA